MPSPCSRLLLLGVLANAAMLSAQIQPASQPAFPLEVGFEPRSVVVGKATPNGAVVVFGSAKEFKSFYLTRRIWKEVLVDDDGDGVVRLAVRAGVPAESAWVVVDLGSGQSKAAAPPGGSARLMAGSMQVGREGIEVQTLRETRPQAYVILVKNLPPAPGQVAAGAWFMGAGDGNQRDADGTQDGAIELRISEAEPLGATTPLSVPAGAGGDDFVYVVDPDTLEYSASPLASLQDIAE